jgi:hypothetical protein
MLWGDDPAPEVVGPVPILMTKLLWEIPVEIREILSLAGGEGRERGLSALWLLSILNMRSL